MNFEKFVLQVLDNKVIANMNTAESYQIIHNELKQEIERLEKKCASYDKMGLEGKALEDREYLDDLRINFLLME
jgi:hypothetical protein